MPNALNINKRDPKIPSWWLFDELRKEGIDYIASFSGKLWTDHNLHDPGITILEVLCYAIADLGYRSNLDIEELLAANSNSNTATDDNFFTPEQILTCNPLTILDYRKMLVDIPGIRNAWLVKADEQEVQLFVNCDEERLQFSAAGIANPEKRELILNGLYKVYLDIDPVLTNVDSVACDAEANSVDAVLQAVHNRLHQHRNLCEDFPEIVVLQDEEIRVCSDIELDPDANPAEVLEAIYEAIDIFLSPRLRFYSLKEMIAEGKSMEEIFEGRPYAPAYGSTDQKFSHGFVDVEQLKKTELAERLLASDFYRVIMEVPGVRAVKKLLLANYKEGIEQSKEEEWILHLAKNHRPVFAPERSVFNFFKGVIRLTADREKAVNRFKKRLLDFRKNKFNPADLDSSIPYGSFREDLADYPSVQHDFPLVYGLGKGHLSAEEPKERRIQALQLKAYLTFFDQLLAGYLSQLANVRSLFSWNLKLDENNKLTDKKTYFQQAVKGIPLAGKIFLSSDESPVDDGLETGTVLAMPVQPFAHPTDRDVFITQLIDLFNNHSSDDEDSIIEIDEEDDAPGQFRFFVIGANGKRMLKSKATYSSRTAASQASEILFFLGTLLQTYEHINWPQLQEYSFYFIYKPTNYTDYLNKITESESAYFKRKDQFLNHLLARFGETFTEYVLLMYALNQEAPDPENIIRDKARFLQNYPDISRNRGRGFNYTNKTDIWNSANNISGFEKRVAGLMGLDNWERRSLNNFEVVLREQENILVIKDRYGSTLFESVQSFAEAELESAIKAFENLLCNSEAYATFDCLTNSVFGFRLLGEDGKVFARFVRTFSSAEIRDEIMACTQNYFCKKPFFEGEPVSVEPSLNGDSDYNNFTGLIVNIIPEDEGYYFRLLAEDRTEIYLQSSQPYPTEAAACKAWVEFLERVKDGKNIEDDKGNYEGGAYSFVVYNKTEEGETPEELAQHPAGYSSIPERKEKKNEVVQFLKDRGLEYRIEKLPDLYSWFLPGKNDQLLLRSFHKFKTTAQAEAAWKQFKAVGTGMENYKTGTTASGKFIFHIEKDVDANDEIQPLVLAVSDEFETVDDRDNRMKEVQKFFRWGYPLFGEVKTHPGKYCFVLLDGDGKDALIGNQHFDTEQEAVCAFFHFQEKATQEDNYHETIQDGTCWYGFEVSTISDNGETVTWAHHPLFYPKAEKDLVQQNLIQYIQDHIIPFDILLLPGNYHFEIKWENCDGLCEVLLVENGEHDTIGKAYDAAILMLNMLEAETWTLAVNATNGLHVYNPVDDVVIADNPQADLEPGELEQLLEAATAYFDNFFELHDENNALIETVPKWEICGATCNATPTEACLLSGFTLGKNEAPVAYHPTTFTDAVTRNNELESLLHKAQCGSFVYTDIARTGSCVIHKEQLIEDGKKNTVYHYELWDKNENTLLWRSKKSWPDEAGARKAFAENWLEIIRMAQDKAYYKLPDDDCPYLSIGRNNNTSLVLGKGNKNKLGICKDPNPDNDCIAYFPAAFDTAEDALPTAYFLQKAARSVPVYQAEDGYRFRLLDDDGTAVLWESSESYETEEKVLLAFNRFLELLQVAPNYQRRNNNYACIYGIGLVEVLLESNRTYADIFSINNVARYSEKFETADDAGKVQEAVFAAAQAFRNLDEKDIKTFADPNGNFHFGIGKLDGNNNGGATPNSNTLYKWQSYSGYPTTEAALAGASWFLTNLRFADKYKIVKDDDDFILVLQDIRLQEARQNTSEVEKPLYAVCPAVFDNSTITIGDHTIFVSDNCDDFEDDACMQTICPAAWDVGLQSFLVDAIHPENYYRFVDYQNGCKHAFRIVTDKYRVARHPGEFHLPQHQAQYKDWLFGYNRCHKNSSSDLPDAQIFKQVGAYYFYIKGDENKVTWCRINTAIGDDNSDARLGRPPGQDIFDDWLDLFCRARNFDAYQKATVVVDEQTLYQVTLVNENTWLSVDEQKYFDNEADADAAIKYSMLYANTMYPWLLEKGKKPATIDLTMTIDGAGENVVGIPLPELLWRSYQGYDTETRAVESFNEQVFDFYYYAQEIDFYELGRPDGEGGRLLQLLNENNQLVALSFETFENKAAWNAAVKKRIFHARRFPYFYYNNKYGFQCFSFEDPPELEWRERTPCDLPASETLPVQPTGSNDEAVIDVIIPGRVIWESIQEYDSFQAVKCVFEKLPGLLKDIENYQAIRLEDCNLFGLELTHPNEVLATHPQRYHSTTALEAAIQSTQDCINAEGFHLAEHILLRPKQGVADHVTIQFWSKENATCPDEVEADLLDHPYLLLKAVFTDKATAEAAKITLIEKLKTLLLNIGDGGSNTVQLIKDLGSINNIVKENIPLLAKALLQTEANATELKDVIFCFNKSESIRPDQLIAICPDCENEELLPEEEASPAACENAKTLLKATLHNNQNTNGTYYIPGADPYSFWMTVVLPYWPRRFQNANFRSFFEDTLRREAPAHIAMRICWLDPKQMRRFERAYRVWLEAFSGNENCNLQDAKNRLVSILFDEEDGITSVYPPARLQAGSGACVPGGGDPNAVLLDFTQLG